MLIINDGRIIQILLSRMIDKETTAILYGPDDAGTDRCRKGRTTKAGTNGSEILHVLVPYVRTTVQNDLSLQGLIVVTAVYAVEPQGKTVATVIGGLGHIKPQAALKRLRLIGERVWKFLAGVLPMSDIGPVQEPLVPHIDHIHSPRAGGLAKITDRQYTCLPDTAFF